MDSTDCGKHETIDNMVYLDLPHGADGILWVTKCVEFADKGAVRVKFDD